MMSKTLKIPVYGLCDCNPYGVSVLDAYKYDKGIKVMGVGNHQQRMNKKRKRKIGTDVEHTSNAEERFSLEVQWIGLLPSQIEKMNLPSNVFQKLSKNDKKRLNRMLETLEPSKSASCIRKLSVPSSSKKKTKNSRTESYHKSSRRQEHLQEFDQMRKYKVELEALHWKGMDYMCRFVYETILAHEGQQQL